MISLRSGKLHLVVAIGALALVLATYSSARAQTTSGGATTNGGVVGGFDMFGTPFPTDTVNAGAGCAFTGYCRGVVAAQLLSSGPGTGDQFRSTSVDALFYGPNFTPPTPGTEGGIAVLFGSGTTFIPPATMIGQTPSSYSAIIVDDDTTFLGDAVILNVCFEPAFVVPQPCGIFSPPDVSEVFFPPNAEVNAQPNAFSGKNLWKAVKSKLPAIMAKFRHK